MADRDHPPNAWALESRFPPPPNAMKKFNRCLLDTQTLAGFHRKCAIQVGKDTIHPTDESYSVTFSMNISPLQHTFEIELQLSSAPSQRMVKHVFWASGDSDAAINVLTGKIMARKGQRQIDGIYRIHSNFAQQDWENYCQDGSSGLLGSLEALQLDETSTDERALRFLNGTEKGRKFLSLSRVIASRAQAAADGSLGTPYYPEEIQELARLNKAHQDATLDRTDTNKTVQQRMAEKEAFGRAERKALGDVQSSYIAAAQGIYSTASAADLPIMSRIRPDVLIIDETSQLLKRVLLVGDHKQLPPTVVAPRNPFSNTGSIYQLERLIDAGTPSVHLQRQYRSHPQISAAFNTLIYDGTLVDDFSTTNRREVDQFTNILRRRLLPAQHPLVRTDDHICSIVLSPEQSSYYTWKSEQRRNSNSRTNFQTPAITFITTCILVQGGFSPTDILVTTFYADQVDLLKALFATEPRVSGTTITTADGSQGMQSMVQIIDCVVLGGKAAATGGGGPFRTGRPGSFSSAGPTTGAGDTLGYLATDRRRFNVVMSRGQAGRIVVGHKDMGNTGHGKNCWSMFMEQEAAKHHIIGTKEIQSAWVGSQHKAAFEQIRRTYTDT
ncbi:AAA domain-containing protein [Elsinoe ampelina]|uniref:AAA domain-containing protein n=1 Tax=Elsinoe ampelina TaxID=302913 RepID=A0A6A6G792_9PEZI|nr:AAA domain-containing protein [Elsinoe ampelina]